MLTINEQPTGPLTADDLRPYKTWQDYEVEPWHLPHMTALMPAEACTDIGANDTRPPITRAGLGLVLLPWVLAVAGWAAFLFFKR